MQSEALTTRTPASNLIVYNSEVALNAPIKIVLVGNKDDKTIDVYDSKSLKDYLNKKQVNTDAINPQQLYENSTNAQLAKNLLDFAKDFKVTLHDKDQEPLITIQNTIIEGVKVNIPNQNNFNKELLRDPSFAQLMEGLKSNGANINIDLIHQLSTIKLNVKDTSMSKTGSNAKAPSTPNNPTKSPSPRTI